MRADPVRVAVRSGFARTATGEPFTVILPRVDVARTADVRAAFAAHADPDATKVPVLAVDRAGWHPAERWVVPPNVRPPRPPARQNPQAHSAGRLAFPPPTPDALARPGPSTGGAGCACSCSAQ